MKTKAKDGQEKESLILQAFKPYQFGLTADFSMKQTTRKGNGCINWLMNKTGDMQMIFLMDEGLNVLVTVIGVQEDKDAILSVGFKRAMLVDLGSNQ